MPTRVQLQGLSIEKAERYGKPSCGAYYRTGSVKSHAPLSRYQRCVVCGRPCTNVHHEPPLRWGQGLRFVDPNGIPYMSGDQPIVLRPALFALCGSGTTGCHNGFHGGARYFPRWVWDSNQYGHDWWNGLMLDIIGQPTLYEYGHWEITDKVAHKTIVIAR